MMNTNKIRFDHPAEQWEEAFRLETEPSVVWYLEEQLWRECS